MKKSIIPRAMSCTSAAVLVIASSQTDSKAALLLYEGFNGYTTGDNLSTITPNGNTVGLDTTGTGSSYNSAANPPTPPTTTTIQATGLSLGSLLVSGTSVATPNGATVAAGNITSTTSSSVIWGSYLVNLSAAPSSNNNGFEIRLNESSVSNSIAPDFHTPYFRSQADSRNNSASVALAYDTGITNGTGALSINTTYILISKFDTGVGGGASLWALNSSQFEDFVTAGRTETYLNSAAVTIKATSAQGGSNGWNTSGTPVYLEIVSVSSNNKYDEIRFGETLFDVTPIIPEPTTGLLFCSLALIGATRRRR